LSADGTGAQRKRVSSRRFEAILFDLDGVLVDTEIWWDEVRIAFATAEGRSWTEDDRAAIMGSNTREWRSLMKRRLNLDMPERDIERAVIAGMLERYGREGPPAISGAVATVRRLARRYTLGVASSAPPLVIETALAGLGVRGLFRAVASSDEVAAGKPAPDVYLLAAERIGVEPAACLVVEDSLNGVMAARAAGMRVVLIPNASIPPAQGARAAADFTLDRLADLDPDLLPS
jgi:HAD superfamily hydrolase (TIGR01509 family)